MITQEMAIVPRQTALAGVMCDSFEELNGIVVPRYWTSARKMGGLWM